MQELATVFFGARNSIHVRAWSLGERIDVRPSIWPDALFTYPVVVPAGESGLAVLFRYGAAVLFELSADEEMQFLAEVARRVSHPFEDRRCDEARLVVRPDGPERMDSEGALVVREASIERCLIVAHALAKSTVLDHYEVRVAEVFDQIQPLAQGMQRGAGGLGRGRLLLRQLGDVLSIQVRTVGRAEVTEKPEITWERPDLERLFDVYATEYDLRERDVALTRKLELISQTAGTLLNLLQHRQTLRVEWYIVLLIVFEIALAWVMS